MGAERAMASSMCRVCVPVLAEKQDHSTALSTPNPDVSLDALECRPRTPLRLVHRSRQVGGRDSQLSPSCFRFLFTSLLHSLLFLSLPAWSLAVTEMRQKRKRPP